MLKSSDRAPSPQVGLLSQDLMVRSRVETSLGVRTMTVKLTDAAPDPPVDLVLVDLNRQASERLAWVRQLGRVGTHAEIICFGRHTEMAELNPAAIAAGASRCVANSHLPETLERWLRSWGGARF